MQTQRHGRKGRSRKASRARLSASTACVPFVDSPGAISPARRAFPRRGNAESPITSREKRKASPLRPRWRVPSMLCYFSSVSSLLFFFFLLPPWKYYELDCIGGSYVAIVIAAPGCINLRKLFLPGKAGQREWESASQLICEPCPCGRRACLNGW